MIIKSVSDESFRKYGRILGGYDFTGLITAMEKTDIPDGVVYEPSVEILESLDIADEFSARAYGEMPVQVGYCNGHNKLLNAVEYHRNSELNIACTDAVLILGLQQDIESDYTYDTSKMEAFLVPAGTGVELYATTLHYAPCHVSDGGFRVVVVLPKGTNYPVQGKHKNDEDSLLAAVNKWLIGHPDAGLDDTCFIGLKGENLSV